MTTNLQQALDTVELTYSQIIEIANEIVNEYTRDTNLLIKRAADNTESLNNDAIRTLMLQLSLKSYTFGDVKEKSAIKAECAEILRKEVYAKKFNETDGSVALRENTAIIETSNEIVAETVYNLVANLFKVKLDEMHRVVDVLKTILMSRLSEAKLTSSITEGME